MSEWTIQQLAAFSERVKQAFLDKRIHAPVHLAGGGEAQLIEIFKKVRPQDWVFSTWRSSQHALLKGLPEEWVFDEILAGRSMYLMDVGYRFICSSIVGGILPIACGVALGIKRRGGDEQVWTFVGDMAARTGIFYEFLSYCDGHKLPVRICIEDNGVSTNTPTAEVWGGNDHCQSSNLPMTRYKYVRTWPHCGIGTHVAF